MAKSYAEVRVTGGDSSLHIRTPRGLLIVELPAGVSLVEGSCREAPGTGDEIHFRMRLNVDQHTDDTGNGEGSCMDALKNKCVHVRTYTTHTETENYYHVNVCFSHSLITISTSGKMEQYQQIICYLWLII